MQAQPARPADPAQPPQAPHPEAVAVGGQHIGVATPSAPLSKEEIAAIRARREELSNQVISATERRDRLARQIEDAPEGPVRAGLEQRLMLLDNRILQLEADIAQTGEQLTNAPAGFTLVRAEAGEPSRFGGFEREQAAAIILALIFAVLMPLSIAVARRLVRRPVPVERLPVLDAIAQRMERLEHAMDAVAIEVERISEGQRFVTRLLGEGQRPAEPLRVGEQAAQRVPRGGA